MRFSVKKAENGLKWLLVIVIFCVIMFPMAWLLSTSLKDQRFMIEIPPQWIPNPITFEHYVAAIFHEMPFFVLLKNSLIIAIGVSLVSTVLGSLSAYGFSRYPFVRSEILLVFLLAGQMFPGVILVIPFYVLLRNLNLLDTYYSLILANTSLALPFTIYMLKGYFDSLPTELEDAALIDGCNRFQTFYKIVLPLTMPGLIATAFMAFVVAWDDYIFALTLITSDERRTLPVAMVGSFVGEFAVKWGEMMAVSVLMSLPVLFLFFFLQKYLVQGLTAGAVKG